jgi:catechol 2,3-dioxygenase-like lactoylglutathione lyase family enzyme
MSTAVSSFSHSSLAGTDPTEETMSTTDAAGQSTTPPTATVALRLEVVVIPVADVDRSRAFYEGLGWRLDADFSSGDDFRVVQLTPPASPTSIIFGKGLTNAQPGSVDSLVLAVTDLEAARADLSAHGAEVSEVFHDSGGVFHHAGTEDRVPGPDPQGRSYSSWAAFSDPDGNRWMLQEIIQRLPGREWGDEA